MSIREKQFAVTKLNSIHQCVSECVCGQRVDCLRLGCLNHCVTCLTVVCGGGSGMKFVMSNIVGEGSKTAAEV